MVKGRLLLALVMQLCLSVWVSPAQSPGILEQDIKPGASPAWSIGPADAPVSVEIFNDYQCPVCATFNVELKRIEGLYEGKVRIIYRNYPLTTIHHNTLSAAQAAEAAGIQGKFVGMMNLLYDDQDQWSKSENAKQNFISYAQKLELDVEKFTADMNSQEVAERINLDVERAKSLMVTGTPTVLVNGKMLGGRMATEQAIKDALKNATTTAGVNRY